MGVAETGAIGMIETGVAGMAKIDAASVAGERVVGIAMSAVILGSSGNFMIRRMNMQNK